MHVDLLQSASSCPAEPAEPAEPADPIERAVQRPSVSVAGTELIHIPGATFMMGSTAAEVARTEREWGEALLEAAYRPQFRSWLMKEVPAHPVQVAPFRLARFPIRNDEYRQFLAASGATGLPWSQPESLARHLPDDHPVWGVSLAEVHAYLAWRGARDGLAWRLPSEAEWEWAAAGPAGRRYPYGEQFDATRCNTIEAGRASTSAVDAHPGGASDFGVEDLAGNVEEWTASPYQPYPGAPAVHDDLMRLLGPGYPVLRGGSFGLGGDLARTRRRHGRHPAARFRITGFRLALDGEPMGERA